MNDSNQNTQLDVLSAALQAKVIAQTAQLGGLPIDPSMVEGSTISHTSQEGYMKVITHPLFLILCVVAIPWIVDKLKPKIDEESLIDELTEVLQRHSEK